MSLFFRRPMQGRERRARVLGLAASLALGLAIGVVGCAKSTSSSRASITDPQLRAERIEALREAIARDHVRIEQLIVQPREEDATNLHRDPEIRVIAKRIEAHRRELDRLEAEAEESPQ